MGSMVLLLKLAWRNGLRNKRRTFLAGIAIGIGLAALIFADSLMLGMGENMIKAATDTFLGQAQISYEGFTDSYELEKTISDGTTVLEDLKKDKNVKNFTHRTMSPGMITSPSNSCSVMLYGIKPDTEKNISKLSQAMVDGDYLDNDNKQKVMIGKELAETLDVEIGSLVVITVAQYATGDLSQAMFRVGGIYSFNVREMDGSMAFIDIGKAQEMLNLGDKFHEIAVNFTDLSLADDKSLSFWTDYENENILSFLSKEAKPLNQMFRFFNFFTDLILSGESKSYNFKKVLKAIGGFTDISLEGTNAFSFWSILENKGNHARPWSETMPELNAALSITSFAIYIIGIILFAVVSLGIMNTLFMSLYERMFEFGVLRAVGTRPFRMALMILFEAGILGVISVIIGIIIGLSVTYTVSQYGIDYTGIEFAGVTFQERLKPVMQMYQYIKYPILLFLFTIIVGLYPAIYAAMLNPVEAMRKTL